MLPQILATIVVISGIALVFRLLDWFLVSSTPGHTAAIECGFDSSSIPTPFRTVKISLILVLYEIELLLL